MLYEEEPNCEDKYEDGLAWFRALARSKISEEYGVWEKVEEPGSDPIYVDTYVIEYGTVFRMMAKLKMK